MNKNEDHHEGSKAENRLSKKNPYQADNDTSLGLKIDHVFSLQPSVENVVEEKYTCKIKNRPASSFYEQYTKNSCKDFSVVLLKIDSFLTGRDRVHFRQWKRRFQRCGKICRKMKVQQMLKVKRKEMREREIWRLEQLDHIERVKKLLDQEPDQSQNFNSKNFHAYLAATNSRKDKDLPSEKNAKPLDKLQNLLHQYNKDEASFYRNYTGLKYESVYENFKKMKKEKKTKNYLQTDECNKAEAKQQDYKSPNTNLSDSSTKISSNLEKQNVALVYGAEGDKGKSLKKQIAAVTPTFKNILPLKDSKVKMKETKQENASNINDLSQIEDLSKFITSKDGKPLKYICTILNGRVALVPICDNPPTSVTQNGCAETKSTPILAQNSKTPTTTSTCLPKEKMIPASQIKVEKVTKPEGTDYHSQETTLGNLKSSFANHPTGNAIMKTTVNTTPGTLLHQEMPKHLPVASPVLNKKSVNDKNLGKTSSMMTSLSNGSTTDQTKSQITQGTGVVNTFLIPFNAVENNTHNLLGQTLNTSLKNNSNQKIQTSGNVVLLPSNQLLMESNGQLALQNNRVINVTGSTEQQPSPAPLKSKVMENQLMVTTSTNSSSNKTAFQILQERNAALKVPPQIAKASTLQDKSKFEPYKVAPSVKPSETNQNFTIVPMADGKFLMIPQQNMNVTTPINVGQATQVLPSNALGSSNQTPMQLQNGLLFPSQPQTVVTNPNQSTHSQLYQLPSGQLILLQQQTPAVQNTAVQASTPVFNVVQNQTTPITNSPFISLVQNPTNLNNSQNLQTLQGAVAGQKLTLQGTQMLAQPVQSVQPSSANQLLIPSGQQTQTLFQLPNGQLLMPVKSSSETHSLHTATQAGLSNTISTGTLGITSSGKIGTLTSGTVSVGASVQGASNTSVPEPSAAPKYLSVSSTETLTSNQLKDTKKIASTTANQRAKYIVYPNTYTPSKKPHILSDMKIPVSTIENIKQRLEQPKSISEMNPILSQKLENRKTFMTSSRKKDLDMGVPPINIHIKQEIPDDDCYITKTLNTVEFNKNQVAQKKVITDSRQSMSLSSVPLKCSSKRKRKEASIYRIDPDDTSRVETYIDISQSLQEKPEASTSNRKKRKPEKVCRVDPDFDDDNSSECLVQSRSNSPDLDYSVFLVPKKPVVDDPRIFNSTVEEIGLRLPDNFIR